MIDTENKLSTAEETIEKLEKERTEQDAKSKTIETELTQLQNQNDRIKEEYQKCAHEMKDLVQKLHGAGNELERVVTEREEANHALEVARAECDEKEKLLWQTKEKSNSLFSRLDNMDHVLKGKNFWSSISFSFCTTTSDLSQELMEFHEHGLGPLFVMFQGDVEDTSRAGKPL